MKDDDDKAEDRGELVEDSENDMKFGLVMEAGGEDPAEEADEGRRGEDVVRGELKEIKEEDEAIWREDSDAPPSLETSALDPW